jgi:methionyl-tRNA synthetase
MISIEDFKKIDIRIGEIKTAEKVPDTDKLLRLQVDFGEEELRQIISGIALYFEDMETLVGKKCTFVANLEPRTIKGFKSNGMIMAVSDDDGNFSLLSPESDIRAGTRIT